MKEERLISNIQLFIKAFENKPMQSISFRGLKLFQTKHIKNRIRRLFPDRSKLAKPDIGRGFGSEASSNWSWYAYHLNLAFLISCKQLSIQFLFSFSSRRTWCCTHSISIYDENRINTPHNAQGDW